MNSGTDGIGFLVNAGERALRAGLAIALHGALLVAAAGALLVARPDAQEAVRRPDRIQAAGTAAGLLVAVPAVLAYNACVRGRPAASRPTAMASGSWGPLGGEGGGQPMAEINTTPLVDVMLVLLVIFIITAPLFHQAIAVDLPRADARKLEDTPRVIELAIDAQGRIHLDGLALARADLDGRLRAAAAGRAPGAELHLRADRGTRYERVTDVMAAAQQAGIARIAFVTEPVQ